MDEKRRSKRAKPFEEGSWDCSVCTYKNPSEAFKCEVCDVRKGTSTRKPRLNQQLVAQQAAQQFPPPPPPKKERVEKNDREKIEKSEVPHKDNNIAPSSSGEESPPKHEKPEKEQNKKEHKTNSRRKSSRPPRLRNIDRSSATTMAVTVDNVTVIITDYKPKKKDPSLANSSASTPSTPSSSSLPHAEHSPSESPLSGTPSGSKEHLNGNVQQASPKSASPVSNAQAKTVHSDLPQEEAKET